MLAIGLADTHVVAVLDLEATLREVINPEIRTEIQAIKPVKCSMYLDFVRAHSLSLVVCLQTTHFFCYAARIGISQRQGVPLFCQAHWPRPA